MYSYGYHFQWFLFLYVQFSSVQSLCCVQLFVTPWTEAHQASLSIANSRSLLKFMSIELVMPSNHLILCHPLLLLPSIFPSIRVCSNESVLHIRWPKQRSLQIHISVCIILLQSKEFPLVLFVLRNLLVMNPYNVKVYFAFDFERFSLGIEFLVDIFFFQCFQYITLSSCLYCF